MGSAEGGIRTFTAVEIPPAESLFFGFLKEEDRTFF
jgi:hypothetical protein